MSNINFGGWTVRYGCNVKWQAQDENLSEGRARQLFGDYCQHPPLQVSSNSWADYVILEDDQGNIVDSCSPGGSYD